MFVRRISAYAPKRAFVKHSQQWHIRKRQLSSTATGASPQLPNHAPVVAGITAELDRLAPRIDIRADQIIIIHTPNDFYETLKRKIRGAKRRIYLSTLYIGKSEHELVSCIWEAVQHNKDLKVSILTDALRGTRESPEPSCASLLSPLVAEFPGQVEIRMYHTPNLTGFRKRILPKRINEGWGLQHMKLYGFDDEVILSGANLSDDYFTNRQDRYHILDSKRVSDYFAAIHHAMCSVSFRLYSDRPDGTYNLEWPQGNAAVSPLVAPQEYIKSTTALFQNFSTPNISPRSQAVGYNTTVYPVLNLPHSLNTELPAIEALLSVPYPLGSSYLFTAGYFNPHPTITKSLLACCSTTLPGGQFGSVNGTVLTASPWANGFYGSKGVSGLLPPAYTLLSRRFLQAARKLAPERVRLREWRLGTVGRPHGWTYHAKGLWLTLPCSTAQSTPTASNESPTESTGPSITIIGSSNYTTRSYSLDSEVGAIIVTSDKNLQARLRQEEQVLLQHSKEVTLEDLKGGQRRVGLGVRIAMWIVRIVGGSL